MVDTFQACSVRLADRWAQQLRREGGARVVVPIHHASIHLALRSIAITAFGQCFEEESTLAELHRGYKECMAEMDEVLRHGPPAVGSERETRFHEAKGVLEGSVAPIVEGIFARRHQIGEPRFFLERMVLSADEAPRPFQQRTAVDEAITFLIGGFHTSGNLFAWAFYYVARHPAVQARIVAEMAAAGVCGPPSFEQLRRLPYLHQVVQETVRCSVLAPWGARESDVPLHLTNDRGQRYVVPARTPIVMALGVTLRDPQLWEEPTRFDPDRFAKGRRVPPLAFSAFGFAGRRVCPGKQYAYTSTEILLATVLARFRLTLLQPGVDAQHHYGFVTKFREEVEMVVEPREA
jgi:cytochrome P450 family 20 subfamily A